MAQKSTARRAGSKKKSANSCRIGKVIVGRKKIVARVAALARQIDKTYKGKEVTILAVLTGSIVFLADLIRKLKTPVRLELVSVSSYPGARTTPLVPSMKLEIPDGLTDRNVLIVDDILDSGQTISLLMMGVSAQRPMSLKSCVLVRKKRPDLKDRPKVDFFGFDIENTFAIGYGLDYDNLYRNLPDIRTLAKG